MREDNQKTMMNTFTAALFGAVVGGVATMFMDRGTRRRVKNRINAFLESGDEKMDEVNGKINRLKERGKEKVAQKLEETEKNMRKR